MVVVAGPFFCVDGVVALGAAGALGTQRVPRVAVFAHCFLWWRGAAMRLGELLNCVRLGVMPLHLQAKSRG